MAGREPLLQDENPREESPGLAGGDRNAQPQQGGSQRAAVEPVVRHAGREEEGQGAPPEAPGYAGKSGTRDWAGDAPSGPRSRGVLMTGLLGVWADRLGPAW